jgi:hypothetical protein
VLIWGQSNATGIGSGATGLTATNEATVIARVGVAGTHQYFSQVNNSVAWGLEMQMSTALVHTNSRTLCVSKATWGSTYLQHDWTPRDPLGVGAYIYAAAQWRLFRDDMANTYGVLPVAKALVWMQGESDSATTTLGVAASEYYGKLTNLITVTRNEIDPNLQWIICRIHTNYNSGHATQDVTTVRDAQTNAAAVMSNCAWVNTDGLSVESTYMLHFDNAGLVGLGQRVADKYVELNP